MRFQSLNEWVKLNEGGSAISSSRRLSWGDLQATYEWVLDNIVPKFGISEDDVDVIGSFGKKKPEDDYGDLDIAISSKAIEKNNNLSGNRVLDFIDSILSSAGFETKIMKGFNQVTAAIPIPGDAEDGIAQVDFMISPDLEWSKFAYNSPDFSKNESKYKGVYRNALLMAIFTEAYKDIVKKTPEGDTEELETHVIRYPEGIWRARKSFMGKRGLVKTGKLLKDFDKFITTDPQEVVELAVGKGYTPQNISTFEKLWHLVNRKDFIHWNNEEDIMKKFAQNLKSMGIPYPEEAIEKYPNIFI